MDIGQIFSNCGSFIWPLMLVSLGVWYVGLMSVIDPKTKWAISLGSLATIASSLGLLGSAFGLAEAMANLGASDRDTLAENLGVAVCSTVVGTAIAITAMSFQMVARRRAEGMSNTISSVLDGGEGFHPAQGRDAQ